MVFRKLRDCTIRVAKTKALISFAVTAKLICVFVFAYARKRFSHNEAHINSFLCFLPGCNTIGRVTIIKKAVISVDTCQHLTKGGDQTARMHRWICMFVVYIWQKQVFS